MKRVAKFEKVSYEQFEKDWMDTFDYPELDTATRREIESIYGSIELPKRATKFSAGYDMFSPLSFELKPGEVIKIPTGIRCEMNNDYVFLIFVRSSVGFKYIVNLVNNTGVIDADYQYANNEGHIFIKLINHGDKTLKIVRGDAIVQGIFLPYGIVEDDHVEEERCGGIGSTNRKS